MPAVAGMTVTGRMWVKDAAFDLWTKRSAGLTATPISPSLLAWPCIS